MKFYRKHISLSYLFYSLTTSHIRQFLSTLDAMYHFLCTHHSRDTCVLDKAFMRYCMIHHRHWLWDTKRVLVSRDPRLVIMIMLPYQSALQGGLLRTAFVYHSHVPEVWYKNLITDNAHNCMCIYIRQMVDIDDKTGVRTILCSINVNDCIYLPQTLKQTVL